MRSTRRRFGVDPVDGPGDAAGVLLDGGDEELLARGEVLSDRPLGDAGALGDLDRARLEASLLDQIEPRGDDRATRPRRALAPAVLLRRRRRQG